MRSSKDSIKNKLRSRAGETITETLVSLLISALALVMLAGVISASSRIVNRSKAALDAYYDACNAMVEMSDASETGTGSVKITGTGISSAAGISEAVSYVEGTAGNRTVLYYRKSN